MTDTNNNEANAGVGLPSGTRLNKYEIVSRMAIGGQAIVYKGFDTMLDRPVAIKQISSHLAGDPRFLERFRREAQILARLGARHPNIVNVYDFIEDSTGLYIVMEFIDGHTLSAVLEHQRYALPIQPALEILWHIASGLKAAHSQGIVHRDIKPGNIIVTRQFHAKLTDFGVAAQKGGQESLAMGTTKYMAPELFEGGTVDARADIYSLGFIAYEMFTGREFFNNLFADVVRDPQSENLRWMKWHSNINLTVPDLAKVNPKVPLELSAVVAKMMEKSPAKRYATMDEVLEDLQAAVAKHKHQKSAQDHKGAKAASAAAALAAAAAGGNAASPPAGNVGDSNDSLSLPAEGEGGEDLPTAAIPRTPISFRTKMIVGISAGAVAVVALLVLAVVLVVSHSKRQAGAIAEYQKASVLYKSGEFDHAAQAFEQISTRYPDLQQGRDARARMLLSEAHLAMQKGEWDKSERETEQVRSMAVLDETEIRDFKSELAIRKQATLLLQKAVAAIGEKAFDDVEDKLTQVADLHGLPTDLNSQADQVRKQLEEARQRDKFDQLLAAGDEAVAGGDFTAADEKYQEAKKLYDNDPAVAQRLAQLDVARKLKDATDRANTAAASNDLKGQVEALKEAAALKPSDDALNAKLKTAQAAEALKRGKEALQTGDFDTAVAAIQESLKFDDSDQTRAALSDAQSQQQHHGKIVEGDALMAEKKYDEAINAYLAALPGEAAQAKLSEAKYQKYLAAGDAAVAARQWSEAAAAFEQARESKSDESVNSTIDARLETMTARRKYADLLDQAEGDLKAGKFKQAADEFGKAQKAAKDLDLPKEADYAGIRQKTALYDEALSLGKSAMDSGQFSMAKGYFIQAKKKMETQEINDLIAKAQAAINAKPTSP